jgi:Flp pilus assembly protein TadG
VNRPRERNDEGSALVEFVGLGVVLLLPLLYLLLSVFAVQKAAFAVTQAAREAGRAYATAPTSSSAASRAAYAVRLALDSQGVREPYQVRYAPAGSGCKGAAGDGAASLKAGSRFVVCVNTRAALPLGGGISVAGRFAVAVDTYRTARS